MLEWIAENWDLIVDLLVAVLGLIALEASAEKAAALRRIAAKLQASKDRGGGTAIEVIQGLKGNVDGDGPAVVGAIAGAVEQVKGRKAPMREKLKRGVGLVVRALTLKALRGGL